jgi:5-phospho-D-xylono-1,4-lactonase
VSTVETVCGPIAAGEMGVTDAHSHAWIAPVEGRAPDAPVLNRREEIEAELRDYRAAGGDALVDCQPGGCGRDAGKLRTLSLASGVQIVACTGFHLRIYYPADAWLWQSTGDAARAHFERELEHSVTEVQAPGVAVRAGFIKMAFGSDPEEVPPALVEGGAAASRATGAAIAVHTEKGAAAEEIVARLGALGVKPQRLVLFHIDKRPDRALHRELAQEGVLLGYDTFYRPKYHPDENVWPLLESMAAEGLAGQVAIGTDMADSALWSRIGQGPGLTGLIAHIVPRLESLELSASTVAGLAGGNIVRYLSRSVA